MGMIIALIEKRFQNVYTVYEYALMNALMNSIRPFMHNNMTMVGVWCDSKIQTNKAQRFFRGECALKSSDSVGQTNSYLTAFSGSVVHCCRLGWWKRKKKRYMLRMRVGVI